MGTITNRYLDNVDWQSTTGLSIYKFDNEVHTWRINISQNIKRLEQFEALLTPDESLRADKYRQQKDTYRFIVSRGAQRTILARYLNTPPAQLQFVLNDNKKPYLVNTNGQMVHYNVSHAGDWIVLAIAMLPVGADVEFIDGAFSFQDILPDNFSREEVAYIYHQNTTERFFTLWTRKEAILKATGQGLGEHLPVTPALDGEHVLDASLTGSDKNWQLNSFMLQAGYVSTVVAEDAGQAYQFFEF